VIKNAQFIEVAGDKIIIKPPKGRCIACIHFEKKPWLTGFGINLLFPLATNNPPGRILNQLPGEAAEKKSTAIKYFFITCLEFK